MAIVKFVHGGKEVTFTEDTAVTDLANFMCKELFGITFNELSARVINFTFEYDGQECYFNPSFIVKMLKQDQIKADVKNLIEDLEQLAEMFGFDVCPQCNVVYPGGKVEHCRKCGYCPEGLTEMKRKILAGEPVELPSEEVAVGGDDEVDPDGIGVRAEGAPAESGDQAGGNVQEPGVVPG
ncbi:hypothetical protein LCGC14_0810200 [marine sediment metagenome]|uniref:Uncharacterized protein n=1 Tax=marine sediment metagenome TaxID=412755 RepID=A0A0F9S706_9ZZZZ